MDFCLQGEPDYLIPGNKLTPPLIRGDVLPIRILSLLINPFQSFQMKISAAANAVNETGVLPSCGNGSAHNWVLLPSLLQTLGLFSPRHMLLYASISLNSKRVAVAHAL